MSKRLYTGLADFFTFFFGAWTLAANLCVYAGWSFNTLVLIWPLPPALAAALFFGLKKPRPLFEEPEAPRRESQKDSRWLRWVLAAALTLFYLLTQNHVLFWLLSILFLLWVYLDPPGQVLGPPEPDAAAKARRDAWIVLGLAGLAAACTLFIQRSDSDDGFYLNLVVTALDHPEQALLAWDGLLGIKGLPLHFPVYRVHSYELLVATWSRLSSLDHVLFYHVLFPPLFAAAATIAYWLVLDQVLPRRSLWALGFVLLVLMAWGDAHRTYGNFAFVRMFQGKALLVSVGVPLIIYQALGFLRRPGLRTWLLLCLSQVAAVGFTSSGLLVAPVVSGLVLAGQVFFPRKRARTLALGLLASGYLAAMSFLVRAEVMSLPDYRGRDKLHLVSALAEALEPLNGLSGAWVAVGLGAVVLGLAALWLCRRLQLRYREWRSGFKFEIVMAGVVLLALAVQFFHVFGALNSSKGVLDVVRELNEVTGGQGRFYLALFGLLSFGLVVPFSPQRQALVGAALLFLAVLANPLFLSFLRHFGWVNLTWRIFWAFPLPLFLGLAAGGLIGLGLPRSRLPVGLLAFAVLTGLFLALPGRWTLARENQARFAWPWAKEDPEFKVAQAVARIAPPDGPVLAERAVATWLPTLRRHPPLASTHRYNGHLARYFGPQERIVREWLIAFISGEARDDSWLNQFIEEIKRLKVRTVVFRESLPWRDKVIEKLARLRFQGRLIGGFEVWILRR